ncbi:glycosyltransferase family 1 protein [Brumimicrobium glaciale]|uniref:Glycosyltransferase family 1 protein n=1 Tax=Brumimicrobium glaciale TaxID=200475 RepID=A0A4Q4KLE7_9FLAO|nr:glycosyltransferase family 4 protein [Brumimicrobium glaciale]RYM34105.1 glycosyltransferase family 1 protein [Brumimicrobium glaciale]
MKPRIVIFAPYPKGTAPSQRFRFEQYLPLLEKDGYEIVYNSFLTEKTWKLLYLEGNFVKKGMGMFNSFFKRALSILKLKKSDILFVHREMSHVGPPVFEWFVAKVMRKKFIYDFDDAIWLPNYSEVNAKVHWLKAYWKVKYCIKWANQLSVGNDYLAEYARPLNPNITVVPTTIDLVNHHNLITDYDHLPVIIGWTGTQTTLRYLDELVPILAELEKEYDFVFRVISNEEPQFNLKSLEFIPWNKETEIKDLAAIQIGVMPLVEDQWSNGKCGFKALQYMALGIPSILSPVGVNTKIVKDGQNGYLCTSPTEWKERLVELLSNTEQRKVIGQAGRKTINEAYSVKANYAKYLEVLGKS